MQLSKRMQAVADFVPYSQTVADVGCDHGYVSIYLAENHRAEHVIAMDVRKGPLARAKENIHRYGMDAMIETRLSDGLHKLNENEADSVVIAGMGGLLMIRILEESLNTVKTIRTFILQPQSDIDQVRIFLEENKMKIIKEKMLIDEGKYYVIMKVVHGESQPMDMCERLYGPDLILKADPVLSMYLEKQLQINERLTTQLQAQEGEKSRQRLHELQEEKEQINKTLQKMKDRQQDGALL